MKIGPYLHFHGNAEEAMRFYMDVFNAQLVGQIHRHGDAPAEYQKDPTTKDWIMNAFIKWDNNEMMFSDVPEGAVKHGTSNYISVTCDSEEQVDNIYAKLSAGAQQIQTPLGDTFWGSKFASLIDKFGVAWYLGWDRPRA